jgi:hypothetical protein
MEIQQNNPIKIENFMDTIFLDFYNHYEQKIFTLEQISHFTPEDKFNYILSKNNLLHTPIYINRNDTLLYNLFLHNIKDICQEIVDYINDTPEPIKTSYFNFYKFPFPLTVSDIYCNNNILNFLHIIVNYDNFVFNKYYQLLQQQQLQQPNYEYYDEYDDDYKTGEITGKSIGGGNNLLIYILVIIILLLLLLYFFFIKK